MEPTLIANCIGIGVNTVAVMIQGYNAFRKTNVERFFKRLIESEQDLSIIGDREDLQRHFFSIVDKVANEANIEKIESWKNAMVHLATDFKDFDFKDNFISTLEYLTVFDLTVLHKIHSTDYIEGEDLENKILDYFMNRNVPEEMVRQSINKSYSNNLIKYKKAVGEQSARQPESVKYSKSQLGYDFINFISENFSNNTNK